MLILPTLQHNHPDTANLCHQVILLGRTTASNVVWLQYPLFVLELDQFIVLLAELNDVKVGKNWQVEDEFILEIVLSIELIIIEKVNARVVDH